MRNFETHEEVKVEDLKEGDLIDLENDEFADPFGAVGYHGDAEEDSPDWHDYEEDHDILGFEYAQVELAETDKPDPNRPTAAPNVMVYTNLMNVRFPLGHKVKRLIVKGGNAQLIVDGQPWKDEDGNEEFAQWEVHALATRVRDQGYTDVKVEYLDD